MTGIPDDIAIIGMAGTFPGAPDISTYWANILGKVEAIREAPEAWIGDPAIYDPDCTPDMNRIYTRLGGFLGELAAFDPRPFGTMPVALSGSEPDQFLAMRAAAEALADAGYADRDFDRKRTGIILGHGIHPHRANVNGMQHCLALGQTLGLLRAAFPALSETDAADIEAMLRKKLPAFNVDTLPGLVPNMMTGRIANRLDLMGPNFIVDGACASSTLAVDAAVTELRRGRADMMLAGGINTSTSVLVQIVFCKIGALSRRGKCRPFDREADGTLLGEGQGVVVLKRLEDALRDEDRIYAVIKGMGTASDGRAMGLMAPRFEGEQLAIQRAYAASGIDPATVRLIEAHATGIPLGDDVEIRALTSVFGERQGPAPHIALGSVKSMIGHTIPAAGMASLIKMALALDKKVLPPTLADDCNPSLRFEATPFFLNVEALPWVQRHGEPRRAALDAFGFGGINTHMILEEAPGRGGDATAAFGLRAQGSPELFVLAAETRADLVAAVHDLAARAITHSGPTRLLAAETAGACGQGAYRLSVTAEDGASLRDKLLAVVDKLAKPETHRLKTRRGVFFADAPFEGKLAFLFPGENSQSPFMLRDLALVSPLVRQWLDWLEGVFPGERDVAHRLVLYPPLLGPTEAERRLIEARLRQVDYGSESVFVADMAFFTLFDRLGLKPDFFCGHSTGENAALFASGQIRVTQPSLTNIVRDMNGVFATLHNETSVPTGTLLTVGALPRSIIDRVLAEHPQIHLTMDNCPNQVILFGPTPIMELIRAQLVDEGAVCADLPMSWAYHTPFITPMADAFASILHRGLQSQPAAPVYSCATAGPFPQDEAGISALMHAQYVSRVRFSETIERLYADGARLFLEVGPGGVLTGFVGDILRDKPHLALSADPKRGAGLEHLLGVLGQLFVHHVPFDLSALYPPEERPLIVPPKSHLASELPFISLDPEETARLRSILAPPSSQVPATEIVSDEASVETWRGCLSLPFAASVELVSVDQADAAHLNGAFVPHLADSDRAYYEATIASQAAPRRRDWLAGRIAARRAAASWLSERGGAGSPLIDYNADGRPQIATADGTDLFLSISHKDGIGAAAVADRPIGIDLERFSAVRDPSLFVGNAFSAQEEHLLESTGWAGSDHVAIAWSAKEAAAKAIGVPLLNSPLDVAITAIDAQDERISLTRGKEAIEAFYALDDDFICVVATPI